MSERAVPFYCPYCGEEDLRPAEQTERVPHGAWYCAACLRTFAVKMIGIGVPDVSELASAPPSHRLREARAERSHDGR
jgi:ribosomal protein L37AE/L43A